MKSVLIIGAGVSGLCTTRHLLEHGVAPVVYEASLGIGGTWVYDASPSSHSSMYQNLITNQPKQIMEFPDHKFPEDTPTYLPHKLVLKYLTSYCEKFNLAKHIKFGHKVQRVAPVPSGNESGVRWKVDVLELESCRHFTKFYDYVVVCNGHYVEANLPELPGKDSFCGETLHSGSYRKPCRYAGKYVAIVGGGPSGVDIAADVAKSAKHVYLSHQKSRYSSKIPANISEMPDIERFNKDGWSITFTNEEIKKVDAVIYCTGYSHSFPFLDEKCGICVENSRVTYLYKHIVNITYNSMLFIGVPVRIPVFKFLNLQALYAAALLAGKITLPSKQDMLLDEENDYNKRMQLGWPLRHAHVMSGLVFEYTDYLSHEAGVDCVPDNIKKLYDFILCYRRKHLFEHKSESYFLNENNEFELKR